MSDRELLAGAVIPDHVLERLRDVVRPGTTLYLGRDEQRMGLFEELVEGADFDAVLFHPPDGVETRDTLPGPAAVSEPGVTSPGAGSGAASTGQATTLAGDPGRASGGSADDAPVDWESRLEGDATAALWGVGEDGTMDRADVAGASEARAEDAGAIDARAEGAAPDATSDGDNAGFHDDAAAAAGSYDERREGTAGPEASASGSAQGASTDGGGYRAIDDPDQVPVDTEQVPVDAAAPESGGARRTVARWPRERGSIELPPLAYDVVFLDGVLSGMSPAQGDRLIERVRSAVRPGGLVIASALSRDDASRARMEDVSEPVARDTFELSDGDLVRYVARGEMAMAFAGWLLLHAAEEGPTAGPAREGGRKSVVVARRPPGGTLLA
ncbi:MAG: hypothetical protein ACK2UL_10000 [Anaerolineae bacterium]